jgi:hypothetical protein
MPFGIPSAAAGTKKMQSVNESNNVNTAMINGPDGEPVEQRTFHQVATVTNDFYLGEADVYVNGVVVKEDVPFNAKGTYDVLIEDIALAAGTNTISLRTSMNTSQTTAATTRCGVYLNTMKLNNIIIRI